MEYVEIFFAVLGALQLVVRATPTDKDDRVVSKLGSFAEMMRNLMVFNKPKAVSRDQNR